MLKVRGMRHARSPRTSGRGHMARGFLFLAGCSGLFAACFVGAATEPSGLSARSESSSPMVAAALAEPSPAGLTRTVRVVYPGYILAGSGR